jgi:threonine/homoserine/homoserine lactone efflux protein
MMVFVTAMLILNITPGPDMLYVIARRVGQGRAAGIASAHGVGAGCFLAFLPQFIVFHGSAPHGSAFRQTVSLGLLFDASGTCVNIAVALVASKAGAFLPA